jgi:hypothetical protein
MKIKKESLGAKVFYWIGVITVGFIVGISVQFVKAWTEPSSNPPGDNVGAPITTSRIGQVKDGSLMVARDPLGSIGLIIGSGKVGIGTESPTAKLDVRGASYFSGNMGIGTITPKTALEVNGRITLTGGNPGDGKVLTSDANGTGSWKLPSAGLTSCKIEKRFTRLRGGWGTGDGSCRNLGEGWECASAGYEVDKYAFCETDISMFSGAGAECFRVVCN